MTRLFFHPTGATAPAYGAVVSGLLITEQDDGTLLKTHVTEEVAQRTATESGLELLPGHPYVVDMAELVAEQPYEEVEERVFAATIELAMLHNSLLKMFANQGQTDVPWERIDEAVNELVEHYAGHSDIGSTDLFS